MPDFEVNKRLKLIIEALKVTPTEFARAYESSKAVGTFHILNNRNGISNKMLDKIIVAYPGINRSWLLTGEGKMFKEDSREAKLPINQTYMTTEQRLQMEIDDLKSRLRIIGHQLSDHHELLKELKHEIKSLKNSSEKKRTA